MKTLDLLKYGPRLVHTKIELGDGLFRYADTCSRDDVAVIVCPDKILFVDELKTDPQGQQLPVIDGCAYGLSIVIKATDYVAYLRQKVIYQELLLANNARQHLLTVGQIMKTVSKVMPE